MKRRKYVVSLILTAAWVTMLFFGTTPVSAEGTLKVGAYGGYFKDSFDKHIFPDFTKETGIKVESVAEPTGEAWLVQLEQAARAGVAPADVSMMAQGPMLKGQRNELWMPLDLSQPSCGNHLTLFGMRQIIRDFLKMFFFIGKRSIVLAFLK